MTAEQPIQEYVGLSLNAETTSSFEFADDVSIEELVAG